MERPAEADYPILDVIKRRWSPYVFADRPVEDHKLRCLLEAARWAASSYNEQPWFFIIARRSDGEAFDKALSCLIEANRAWASRAPVLMLTIAKTKFDRNDRHNRVHLHDLGLAMGNLCIQATAMGLFVHQMAGIDPDRVREVYGLPEHHDPVTGVAIGNHDENSDVPDELRERERGERGRRPLRNFVFANQWGQAAPLVTP